MAFSIFLILCIFYFSTCVFPDPRRARMRLLMRVMSPVTEERKGFISTRLQWRGQSHPGSSASTQKMLTTLKQLYFFYISIFLNPEIEEVLGIAPFQRTGDMEEAGVAKLQLSRGNLWIQHVQRSKITHLLIWYSVCSVPLNVIVLKIKLTLLCDVKSRLLCNVLIFFVVVVFFKENVCI